LSVGTPHSSSKGAASSSHLERTLGHRRGAALERRRGHGRGARPGALPPPARAAPLGLVGPAAAQRARRHERRGVSGFGDRQGRASVPRSALATGGPRAPLVNASSHRHAPILRVRGGCRFSKWCLTSFSEGVASSVPGPPENAIGALPGPLRRCVSRGSAAPTPRVVCVAPEALGGAKNRRGRRVPTGEELHVSSALRPSGPR
jgi:hypothetical protein